MVYRNDWYWGGVAIAFWSGFQQKEFNIKRFSLPQIPFQNLHINGKVVLAYIQKGLVQNVV